MITQLFLAVGMVCMPPIINNKIDKIPYLVTKLDREIYNKATKRCGEIYKDSPCITQFIIKTDDWGDRMYSIACGQAKKSPPPIRLY